MSIGIVVPYDFALDRELWRWTPESVDLHLTRTPPHNMPVGIEQAAAVGDPDEVADSVRALLTPEPGVVAYGCTSGSFVAGVDGERRLAAAMLAAGAPRAVTTSGALLAALAALDVRRVAVATPYDAELTPLLTGFLHQAGYRVTRTGNLGLTGHIWRVPGGITADLVRSVADTDAEAIFVSCTNLPTYELIAQLEAELGRPVLSANQVTMWAALAAIGQPLAGNPQRLTGVTMREG